MNPPDTSSGSDRSRGVPGVARARELRFGVAATVVVAAGRRRASLATVADDLARRAGRVRRSYGLALAPYAGWTAFATALNAEVTRLNPPR